MKKILDRVYEKDNHSIYTWVDKGFLQKAEIVPDENDPKFVFTVYHSIGKTNLSDGNYVFNSIAEMYSYIIET